MEKIKISLHPRLAAILDLVVSLVFVWFFPAMTTLFALLIWFGARLLWWLILVIFAFRPSFMSRWRHFLSLTVFNLGCTLILIFIDWSLTLRLMELVFMILPAFSFWVIPPGKNALSVMGKPERRIRLLMVTVGLAGLWSGFMAAVLFQEFVFYWQELVAAAVVVLASVFIAFWWWREYGIERSRRLWLAIGIFTVLMAELCYTILLWPIGYLMSGITIIWIWYVLWLMFRFLLSSEGIDWKRQKLFLIINLVLFIVFLSLVVRWK